MISKITVYYDDSIAGFKFFDKDGKCVLETEIISLDANIEEIFLQEGERLLGVRSKSYNDGDYVAFHCNMVFIFGKMA